MKRLLWVTVFLSIFTKGAVFGQVTFIVQSLPSYTPATDSLYIAGNFNGWNPGAAAFMLHKNSQGKWSITLASQPNGSNIKFKFTRGSWDKVEKGAGGEEIPDRSYTFGTSDSVDITIYNWADAGGGSNSTAAENVKIISTDFYIPQLDRTRRIWMYFPPGYETSGLNYPVLYMHDGQNLFDIKTSYSGEWEIDETLNKLAEQGKRVPLVVGIDNGGSDRISEYTPWKNPQYGGGDGEKYIQFIVETLKPYIDQHYRTLSARENTGIMGSSLGGLISHFGSLKYQDIFSKAGLFSPSYWFSDSIWSFTHESKKQHDMRFYQLCGSNESTSMVPNMQRMNDSLLRAGFVQNQIANKVVEGGQHNEKLWRENFREAYLWLFNDYVNSIEENKLKMSITCHPNPATDVLFLKTDEEIKFDTVIISDTKGTCVMTMANLKEPKINVKHLSSGSYIIKCITGNYIIQGQFIKK